MNRQKWKTNVIKILQFLLNPRFLLCFGLGWIITNGWSYILMALGTYFKINWMMAVAGAYLAFLWFPFSPEKLATLAIAIALLRWLFPKDEKTLATLKKMKHSAKEKYHQWKTRRAEKNASAEHTKRKHISKRKWICIILPVAVLLFTCGLWIASENDKLTVSHYSFSHKEIPPEFSGFSIAQVSDLHNTAFGSDNKELLTLLRKTDPDIIVLTGDLIDSYHTDLDISLSFAQEAVGIAPTYYVTGNHEARTHLYPQFMEDLQSTGVIVLENETVQIDRFGKIITLLGASDPSFYTGVPHLNPAEIMDSALFPLVENKNGFTVLLSHRPELFEIYKKHGVNLVFSGHAHGGQIRLPFVGGIIAPGQGLFPKHVTGTYTKGDTTMVVSRGLGNSLFPFRVNNPPEIVVVTLQCTS